MSGAMPMPGAWWAALAAAAALSAPDGANWYLILAQDGATIGHSSVRTVTNADGREVTEDREIRLRETGDEPVTIVEQDVTRQDARGRTVAISHYWQSGASWVRTEVRIAGDRAEIVRQSNGDRRTISVALPPGVRFDSGGGLLASWDPARAARLEFDNFSLDAMGIEHVVIASAPGPADPAGAVTLLRTRYDGGALRSVSRLRLDRDGRVIEIVQPMFGTSAIIRPTDRETALRPAAPYRAVPNAMIPSPYRIAEASGRGHIRYSFSFNDGLVFAIPQTAEQGVAAEGSGVTVDICADCGPGLPTDPAYLADALRPTAWLQSDRPELRGIAAPVARQGRLSETRRMELLLERARPYLGRLEFGGHHSALETIRRRAGDCTEAAVLLAALGRAAGIPTRVANGLVYSRERYHGISNAFLPHSWTLAYVDGAWRSFDLALETFDATHIALTVGDGDARSIQAAGQLASLLHWDRMSEVRARPAG
jgi:hypothetical protein